MKLAIVQANNDLGMMIVTASVKLNKPKSSNLFFAFIRKSFKPLVYKIAWICYYKGVFAQYQKIGDESSGFVYTYEGQVFTWDLFETYSRR